MGRRERVVARLSLLSASAALLFANDAQAQDWTGGGGVFFGYAFGAERTGFDWGLEGFATNRVGGEEPYGGDAPYGVGPLLQFGFLGAAPFRLTLAAHAVAQLPEDGSAISAELGFNTLLGRPAGFGLHLGVVPQFIVLNAYLRYDPVNTFGAVGGGLRLPPAFDMSEPEAVVGRPWRDAEGAVARLDSRDHCAAASHCRREGAGRAWESDASDEAASVPAFLALAAELLAVKAPLTLVERALEAADDEIRHAFLCASLASRYLGMPVHPKLPKGSMRAPLEGSLAFERLALESFWDGCTSEAAAARVAARCAACASDPAARRAQRVIARDEQRHAELGFDVLRWVLSKHDAHATNSVRRELTRSLRLPDPAAPGGLEFGRASGTAVSQAHREAHEVARRRVARMLEGA